MTVPQLEQGETCWCAATAHDSVSVGTGWDMLVCCHCSWHCLSWNRLRHVGVLPLLVTVPQLQHFETCWCAARTYDSVSVATFWDMLVCCPCLWQCLSCNILRHVGVLSALMTMSGLETVWDVLVCCQCSWQCLGWKRFETCWCAASAYDSVSEGTEIRDHHCMSVRNSALYQTRTSNSGRTIGGKYVFVTGQYFKFDYVMFYTYPFCYKVCLNSKIVYILACICMSRNRHIQYLSV